MNTTNTSRPDITEEELYAELTQLRNEVTAHGAEVNSTQTEVATLLADVEKEAEAATGVIKRELDLLADDEVKIEEALDHIVLEQAQEVTDD